MKNNKWIVRGESYAPKEQIVEVAVLPCDYYSTWINGDGITIFDKITLKTDNLILTGGSKADTVINEIKGFWDKKEAFKEHGILFKRGILLYGPPGTGKTSILNIVLRDSIEAGAIVIRMDDVGYTMRSLKVLRKLHENTPIVVVIEDIDNWQHSTAILALLDGSGQIDNVTYLATTNYIENLPDRIKNRPSRFDKCVYIGFPSANSRKEYFKSLIDDSTRDLTELVEKSKKLTYAHMKELFISTEILGNSIDSTVERLRDTAFQNEEDEDEEVTDNASNGAEVAKKMKFTTTISSGLAGMPPMTKMGG